MILASIPQLARVINAGTGKKLQAFNEISTETSQSLGDAVRGTRLFQAAEWRFRALLRKYHRPVLPDTHSLFLHDQALFTDIEKLSRESRTVGDWLNQEGVDAFLDDLRTGADRADLGRAKQIQMLGVLATMLYAENAVA